VSLKRGWCPSLDRPMQSGDGLLVRVQPRRATLTPQAARALADAAATCGNGIIELTQRGNLQLRGLRADTIAPFAAAMEAADIPSPGPLLPPPLLGLDPGLDPRTEAVVAALEAAFADDPRLATLPGKFAVAVDGGGALGGRAVAADLTAFADGRVEPAAHSDAPPPVGPLPGAFGLAPPFAQFDAAMLHDLAGQAARRGGSIRVTPWRALLLTGTKPIDDPRWITDAADPRLLVTACIGMAGCLRGTVPTRTDAARLRPTQPVHVSGCIKGCAHPGPSALTLVGRDGAYDRVRHGRTTDTPDATGLTFEAILRDA